MNASGGCKRRLSPLGELTALPQTLYLNLRGHFEAEIKEGEGKEGRGKWREVKGREGRKTPPNKFLVTAMITTWTCGASDELASRLD